MDEAGLVNLALQSFGNRTTITAAQLAAGSNNEAKQANITFANTRDSLLRMAPWDCGMKTRNLTYITSVPGTPENQSAGTELWEPGQPRPPWAYEYQYPVDCLRACWIIPASQTSQSGVPITTAVTNAAPYTWLATPIRFKIATDEFYPVTSVVVNTGGTGYFPGDILTAVSGPVTSAPYGAPVQIRVLSAPGGVVTTYEIVNQIIGSDPSVGGSYFVIQGNPVSFDNDTSAGSSGATFNLTYGAKGDQRVILTNQQYATLVYVKQVTNPNVWDPMFQDAFIQALGADMCFALTGDKALANININKANNAIMEARKVDGNEGLTINNVTPDWIRARGYASPDSMYSGPQSTFDWGGLLPTW